MYCTVCSRHETSGIFVKGSNNFKKESLRAHDVSHAHRAHLSQLTGFILPESNCSATETDPDSGNVHAADSAATPLPHALVQLHLELHNADTNSLTIKQELDTDTSYLEDSFSK